MNTSDPRFDGQVEALLRDERRNYIRVGTLVLEHNRNVPVVTDANAEAFARLMARLSDGLTGVIVPDDKDNKPKDDSRFWEAIIPRLPALLTLSVARSEFVGCNDTIKRDVAAALAASSIVDLSIAPDGLVADTVCQMQNLEWLQLGVGAGDDTERSWALRAPQI